MAKPPQPPTDPPRKSSKVVPLAVLGVLSVMVVGYCAAVSDDEEVVADCVMYVDDDSQAAEQAMSDYYGSTLGNDSESDDASASPSPSPTASSLPAGSYQVVDDDYCDDDDGSSTNYGHSYYGSRGAYMWYYGGRRVGNTVQGGTTLRPSDVNISSRGGKEIQRGGFGRSWSGGS
ncbi:hypothetical protein E1286_29355 [Nonomuraea terrae]|uniref:Uncharacterized protein n=1 Tax=Nonomuraea terrae TaxID=2530383 RepID=A0A4R4YGB2_9ACTN|nr:hypothetical protein [Nonomuraea terrae]TDD43220.1 hypothetical protein E1286_29355 [Nonomuraea terrae]